MAKLPNAVVEALRMACYGTRIDRRTWTELVPHTRIVRDPAIMMGKPVVKGTRITVEHILRCLAAGDSADHILRNYPHLTAEDIRAAQAYAADYLAHEGIEAAE